MDALKYLKAEFFLNHHHSPCGREAEKPPGFNVIANHSLREAGCQHLGPPSADLWFPRACAAPGRPARGPQTPAPPNRSNPAGSQGCELGRHPGEGGRAPHTLPSRPGEARRPQRVGPCARGPQPREAPGRSPSAVGGGPGRGRSCSNSPQQNGSRLESAPARRAPGTSP